MLNRAEVNNYKSIASADITFGHENVIVGPNGVGKSNFLDAIHFVRDAVTDGLDHAVTKRHGVNSIRRWSKTKPYNISIKLSFSGNGYWGDYRVVIASAGGEYSVAEESGNWYGDAPIWMGEKRPDKSLYSFTRQGGNPVQFSLPETPFTTNSKMVIQESDLLLTQLGMSFISEYSFLFKELHSEVASAGAYSIYPNKIREPQSISNLEILSDDGTNLASIIRQMRVTTHRGNRELLTTALKQVMPQLTEIRIESAGGFYVPVFRVKEAENGYSHDLNMSQVSDGTLRMLGMLTAFYQPKAPMRITLEEPEQMVHPGLLPVLVEASRDYLDGSNTRQTFLTTHSPSLLDMFDAKSIIGCIYVDGISKISPISSRQMEIIKSRLMSAGELLVAEGIFA